MLVLFDLDDTLLDDVVATDAAVTALHSELALTEPREDFHARWLVSLRVHYDRYVAGEISFLEQRRIRMREAAKTELSDSAADASYVPYVQAYERGWTLLADALPCLDALRGHQLGLVSNGNAKQQRQKLLQFGLLERFACVVTSDEAGFGKPDPRIFRAACERCGVSPSDAVHVGDRFDTDVVGALSAGVRPIWLNRVGAEPVERAGVVMIRSLAELPTLVGRATPQRLFE